MQEFISDLTVEQFAHVCGVCIGIMCIALVITYFSCYFIASLIDGKIYYKTKEYYASLRYVQKYFRHMKRCGTMLELDYSNQELGAVLELLRCQGVLPRFLYKRLDEKANEIFNRRKIDFANYWHG